MEEKMKVQDLMIGDLVDVIQNGEKHFAQVQMIDGYGDNAMADECICDAIYYSIDEIEPINLTPEILEKNGFVKQEDGYFRYFKSYDENYYFGFESISYLFERKTAKITKEHSQSGMQEKVEFICEYLHELQHALKLCGIDKEIEP